MEILKQVEIPKRVEILKRVEIPKRVEILKCGNENGSLKKSTREFQNF